jgi:hypothetical protein
MSTTQALRVQRWQWRTKILKTHLNRLSPLELLLVRPDYYAIRFEWGTLSRDAAKAYNPNQPRVPAGNPDGGQWTSDGSSGGLARVRLAGPPPTNDPPDLPKDRPHTSQDRTAAIKEAARQLGRFGGPIGRIIGAAYWLYEYEAQITASLDPPNTLEELQKAVSTPKLGYEIHHIVEQTPARQDGFRENLVRIPTLKHRDINAWYQTKNDDFGGLAPPDYLRGRSWDERTKVGLDALIEHGVLVP